MFTTGILAHSLLLPLISILVELFVVNFLFVDKVDANIHPQSEAAIVCSLHSASANQAASSFNFFDFYSKDEDTCSVAYWPSLESFFVVATNDRIVPSNVLSLFFLRAPPL